MTWRDYLSELSGHMDEAFSATLIVTPMVQPPNGRAHPDPNRGSFVVCGVPTEAGEPMHSGRKMHDGMKHTLLTTSRVNVTVQTCLLAHQLTQGDMIEVPEMARTFRVLDVEYDMPGRSRIWLESVTPIPAA